jgi:hypothetical protein
MLAESGGAAGFEELEVAGAFPGIAALMVIGGRLDFGWQRGICLSPFVEDSSRRVDPEIVIEQPGRVGGDGEYRQVVSIMTLGMDEERGGGGFAGEEIRMKRARADEGVAWISATRP